ncbi:MAG: M13-type metalloendopeptidase [Acidobacteriota bacterium]|nr:M13-type metalloendopeptidase [Acidobacteriota bacterium]
MSRETALAVCLTAVAACASPTPPPPPVKSPVSGIDLAAFDKSVRPQDDFFQHVNGGWLKNTEIPADKSSYGAFDILFDKAQTDLKAIVEEAGKSTTKTPGSEAQKIGDFYESFMNEALVEKLGLSPLNGELAAIDAIKTKTDLARHFGKFFKLNLINPVVGYVDGDAQQPTHDVLYLYQGGLGLPDRDYYLKDDPKLKEYREKYVAFLTTTLQLAGERGAPLKGVPHEQMATDIFALETRLARAHWTNVENRDAVKTYNKVTLADLGKQFPGFDWPAWTAELGVGGNAAVVVSQPSYLKAFAGAVNELPVERWKPYLKASLLNGFAPYLSKAYVDAEFGFYNTTLRGVKEQQPRWKRAVNLLNGNLGEMLGKLYVERHFKPEAKARMEALVENLRVAYKAGIDQLEWMGPDTRKQAQEKLARFRPKVGYPSKWRDYSKLEITKDDLVGNVLRAFTTENHYQLGKAGKPIDPEQWGMTPQTINAYYNPVRNEIVFPAAILQPPFFNLEADDAVNYGGIGAIIGHEMGHGFDDQGRRFDATGALRDWWTKQDEAEYQKRAQRLVDQFNEFEPLPGLKVNGELTLGENIADLTGLVISRRAYQLSLKGVPPPVIDGIPADQRFYMGWGQSWKAKQRDEALRQQVMTNPHSPEMYRANGPIRNIPEFFAAFGVKEGDQMYLPPDRQVKIW